MISIPFRFLGHGGISALPPGRPVISVVFCDGFSADDDALELLSNLDDWRHQPALIDTSASYSMISRSLAERLRLQANPKLKVIGSASSSDGPRDLVSVRLYLTDCRRFLTTEAVVADLDPGEAMRIGMNVISEASLTLDYINGRFELLFPS
ncbi:retropepsin-like aspartic protease [Paracoccus sp. MBLB3053]|uniref:Retropepsin-like aspartic protease n=1 Tax=Paracoccus aurantius TaxID=3073814 RepID=A0ABU2HU80_9RHOB|nr:retropepsin-like aspartic protease [Paracoccus sp. MBLB3053]MDS9468598.1 retropepsin-like aspartic protease [Paracoccus sp. MBLB3053]